LLPTLLRAIYAFVLSVLAFVYVFNFLFTEIQHHNTTLLWFRLGSASVFFLACIAAAAAFVRCLHCCAVYAFAQKGKLRS